MARQPKPKDEIPAMTRMRGDKPASIKFEDLINILAMVRGQRRQSQLIDAVKSANLEVIVPVDTVNAVKEFVAKHPKLSAHPIGQQVLNAPKPRAATTTAAMTKPARNDPFDNCCGFSSRG